MRGVNNSREHMKSQFLLKRRQNWQCRKRDPWEHFPRYSRVQRCECRRRKKKVRAILLHLVLHRAPTEWEAKCRIRVEFITHFSVRWKTTIDDRVGRKAHKFTRPSPGTLFLLMQNHTAPFVYITSVAYPLVSTCNTIFSERKWRPHIWPMHKQAVCQHYMSVGTIFFPS